MRIFTFAFLLLAFSFLQGQGLPNTNILLFDIEKKQDGHTLSNPQFITAWNRDGYNNQPAWLGEQKLLMTVGLPSDTTQTEIWELDLARNTRSRVTATAESEFSATPMGDGRRFSSVLIENDGENTQRLWEFPLDRSSAGRPIFSKITGVGYHCWLRDTLAALFIVEKPLNKLVVAGLKGQNTTLLSSDPGRSLHRLSNGGLAYITKATAETWYIKTWDPKTKTGDIICKTRPKSEDFCVLADGSFLMGEGARLYRLRPGKELDWTLIADLSKYGVKTISRLAANSDGRLAVVVN